MKCSSKIKLESLRTILKNMMKNQTDIVKLFLIAFLNIIVLKHYVGVFLASKEDPCEHNDKKPFDPFFKITVVILMVQAINARSGSSFILNPFHYSPNYCCQNLDILYSRFTITVTIIKLFN